MSNECDVCSHKYARTQDAVQKNARTHLLSELDKVACHDTVAAVQSHPLTGGAIPQEALVRAQQPRPVCAVFVGKAK